MKQIAKLILKCILVMLPFIGMSVYSATGMMWYGYFETPSVIWNKEVCNTTLDKEYRIVTLGDSTSNAAYAAEVLSDDTLCLSYGGASPMENYYTMVEYLSNNKAPEIVYISFVDGHFSKDTTFWYGQALRHRYSLKTTWEMYRTAVKYNEDTICEDNDIIDFISFECYMPSKFITMIREAKFNQRYEDNLYRYDMTEVYSGRYIARNNRLWEETQWQMEDFCVDPLFDDYYRRLLDLCLENNIEIHLIKLPMPSTVTYPEGYDEAVSAYYDNLLKDYPTVTFEIIENYPNEYFYDHEHMNVHGALKFSLELRERYPGVFSDTFTEHQLLAIDNSLREANWMSDVFDYLNLCTDYTIVVYDGVGDFAERYASEYADDNLLCLEGTVGDTGLYVVGQQGLEYTLGKFYSEGDVIKVQEVDYLEWQCHNVNGYSIIATNNSNGNVVFKKDFAADGILHD